MDGTTNQTLFSKTMFDSLFEKLRHNGGDVEIKRVCGALSNRGYSTEMLVDRVRETIGANAAERVRRLCHGEVRRASRPVSSSRRFRVSWRRRLELRMQDWRESADDVLMRLAIGVQRLVRRRRR